MAARAADWIAAAVTVVDGAALAWLGAFHPEKIQMRGFGVVGIVFGLIALRHAPHREFGT